MNTPPAKAGGFGLRLKAGRVAFKQPFAIGRVRVGKAAPLYELHPHPNLPPQEGEGTNRIRLEPVVLSKG